MTKSRYLPATATKCRTCKAQLDWEVRGGMRMIREIDGQRVIQARCSSKECGIYWGVKAQ